MGAAPVAPSFYERDCYDVVYHYKGTYDIQYMHYIYTGDERWWSNRDNYSYENIDLENPSFFKRKEKVVFCIFRENIDKIMKLQLKKEFNIIIYDKSLYTKVTQLVKKLEKKIGVEITIIKCWDGVV